MDGLWHCWKKKKLMSFCVLFSQAKIYRDLLKFLFLNFILVDFFSMQLYADLVSYGFMMSVLSRGSKVVDKYIITIFKNKSDIMPYMTTFNKRLILG